MKTTKFDISIFLLLIVSVMLIITNGCQTQSAEDLTKVTNLKSPADFQLERARKLVKMQPEKAHSYVHLAMAILKKVRETGDYSLNREAEVAITKALNIDKDNFVARILKIQIYLSEHEFQKALGLAEKLQEENPDSEAVLAAITDARTELGKYEEAVLAAQKFVDFRPNANSYARVANLRSLYGDTAGAIKAYEMALQSADPSDREILAWHYSQLGKVYFNSGEFAKAEKEFDAALKAFPEYHWALAGKGQVHAANGDLRTALKIYKKLNEKVTETERAIFLGDIYKKLGNDKLARETYDAIVKKQKDSGGDMHRIALFWADNEINLNQALKIARDDRKENNDLLASDTLAWCLYKKGMYREAKKYSKEAMRLGTKNALFYYHRGMIEKALGNKSEAKLYLKLSLKTNPSFDLLQADIAGENLAALS